MKPLALVLLVFLILLFTQSCRFTRKLLYYPLPVPESRIKLIKERYPQVVSLEIPVTEKIYSRGWLIRKDLAALPTIIYFGGNGEEVSANIELMERGVEANFVLMNYRGYGRSDGSPREKDLKADALVIYDHIIDQYQVEPESVIAAGRSLGTGIAAYLAWKRAVPRLIMVSPYDSIARVASRSFPKWLVKVALEDKYQTIEFSPRLESKILAIVSENDEVIPIERSRRLYESLTCDKKIVYVNAAGHNDFEMFPEYWAAWREFTEE